MKSLKLQGSHSARHAILVRAGIAILGTHVILAYGEKETTFQLLANKDYYLSFPGSFLIAFILIESVYQLSTYLDARFSKESLRWRITVQLLIGIVGLSFLAFILATIYFTLRGIDILKTTYQEYDFQFIVANLTIINLICFIYNYIRRTHQFHPQSQNHENDLLKPSLQAEETNEKSGFLQISPSISISFNEICYIEMEGRNVQLYTMGEKYMLGLQLKDLLNILPEQNFIQINRQIIVGIKSIIEVKACKRGSLLLNLNNGKKALVSQARGKKFVAWLNKRLRVQS